MFLLHKTATRGTIARIAYRGQDEEGRKELERANEGTFRKVPEDLQERSRTVSAPVRDDRNQTPFDKDNIKKDPSLDLRPKGLATSSLEGDDADPTTVGEQGQVYFDVGYRGVLGLRCRNNIY